MSNEKLKSISHREIENTSFEIDFYFDYSRHNILILEKNDSKKAVIEKLEFFIEILKI